MSEGIPYERENALAIAHELMEHMTKHTEINWLYIVGSLRRGKEVVHDIDLLCVPSNLGSSTYAKTLWINYLEMEGYEIQSAGDSRIIAEDMGGTGGYDDYPYKPNVNIFFTEKDSFGAALMHTTGPSIYNIRKRNYVKYHMIEQHKLNEKGLYNSEGVKIAGETEEGIYDALGWEWCAPYDRK